MRAARVAGVDAPQPRVELEVPPAAERAVDDRLLEDDAADAAGGERLGGDVEAGERGRCRRSARSSS